MKFAASSENLHRVPFLCSLTIGLCFVTCGQLVAWEEAPPESPSLTLPAPLVESEGGPAGGENVETLKPVEVESASGPVLEQPAEAAPVVVPAAPEPLYWIVSTRSCNQDLNERPCCRYIFYQVTPQGCVRRSTEAAFQRWLQPGCPICFHIHGSFVSFNAAISDSWGTYHWLKRLNCDTRLQFVHFTWPSDDGCSLPTAAIVRILARESEYHSLYLAQFLHKISPEHPISLIGHSHGARIVAATLHLLGGGAVHGHCLPGIWQGRRIRAVFAAAALNGRWLRPGERFGRALYPVECVVNLRNQHDLALRANQVRRPWNQRSLGITGIKGMNRGSHWQLCRKVIERDVTDHIGHEHRWPAYFRHHAIAQMIQYYVYFNEPKPAAAVVK